MKYEKFENLPVWQESRVFTNQIFQLINKNLNLNKNYSLSDQLRRASYSIMLNIAEGFERQSNKEFANFINISKGSAGEVRCILYILNDNGYINETEFKQLLTDIENVSKSLSKFRQYLVNSYIKSK